MRNYIFSLFKLTYILFICIVIFFPINLSANFKPDTLVVTNSVSWAPFSYINHQGDPDGLLIEFWRMFGIYNNVEIKYDLTSWNESLKRIKKGKADCHGGLFRNSEREEYMLFSNPLNMSLETRLFTKKDVSFEDLVTSNSVAVGIVKGDFIESYLRDHYPNLQLHTFQTSRDVILAAVYGKISTFALDFPTVSYNMVKFPQLNDFHSASTLNRDYMRIGVQKGNTKLLRFINEGIDRIPEERLRQIVGKRIQYEEKTPDWLLSFIILIVSLSVVIIIVVYISLLKKNEKTLRYLVKAKTSELEEKNSELTKALDEVKKLSGILPICSSCKKIKDSKGYWNQVETYITTHSDAQFSHGLCESCAEKIYGKEDWYKEMKDEEKKTDD